MYASSVDKVNIGASAVLEHLGKRERLGDRLELADVMDAVRQARQLTHCAVEGYFHPLLVEPVEKFLVSLREVLLAGRLVLRSQNSLKLFRHFVTQAGRFALPDLEVDNSCGIEEDFDLRPFLQGRERYVESDTGLVIVLLEAGFQMHQNALARQRARGWSGQSCLLGQQANRPG